MKSKFDLADYLKLQANELRNNLEKARQRASSTNTGVTAEIALRDFLKALLPQRFIVGMGEAIAAIESPAREIQLKQSGQKDVIICDAISTVAFGGIGDGPGIFPVEGIYAVIEVKTSITSVNALIKAIHQANDVVDLCEDAGTGHRPFTSVFAFESTVKDEILLEEMSNLALLKRVDAVFILNPKQNISKKESSYFFHWLYRTPGKGRVDFMSINEAHNKKLKNARLPVIKLTYAKNECGLFYFYLFLHNSIIHMRLGQEPNLWKYGASSRRHLGWKANER